MAEEEAEVEVEVEVVVEAKLIPITETGITYTYPRRTNMTAGSPERSLY